MAASTAGQITLVNAQGNARTEPFTMTPTANQYVTFTSTGDSKIKTLAGGEALIAIVVNNDGVTTVTKAKITIDGQDIRNTILLAPYAIDNAPIPNTLPAPIKFLGGKEIAIQVLA